MNEDIIRMAREQGLPETEVEGVFRVNSDDLGRMLAAERESCAKLMDEMAAQDNLTNYYKVAARAIRERKS